MEKTVRLVGFDDFSDIKMDKIKEAVLPLIDKYKRMFGLENVLEFKIVCDTIRKKQEKYLYEVIGRLDTIHSRFHATKSGWEIVDVVDEVVQDLSRQIVEKKERLKKGRKLPDNA